MKVTVKKWTVGLGILAFTASCAATSKTLTPAQQLSSQVIIDGSSTVFPITDAIAKGFQKQQANKAQVNVGISGTTGGFDKFCAGETDISNASRPILAAEMEACDQNQVRYIEMPVAYDALTIAVHPQNTWAKDITVAELKKMWEPSAQRKITRWKQVRSSWPDRPLHLYGAGQKSGTFDYFTEAIVGKVRASRIDYTASEDDDVLVEGISRDPNALGYFGLSYYEENQNKVKALAVDNGKGPVQPSRSSVEKVQYQPLSRPLFIYVNARSAQVKPVVKEFVDFYIQKAPTTVSSVG
jgi:phosphate transport system substrate-binding protein